MKTEPVRSAVRKGIAALWGREGVLKFQKTHGLQGLVSRSAFKMPKKTRFARFDTRKSLQTVRFLEFERACCTCAGRSTPMWSLAVWVFLSRSRAGRPRGAFLRICCLRSRARPARAGLFDSIPLLFLFPTCVQTVRSRRPGQDIRGRLCENARDTNFCT